MEIIDELEPVRRGLYGGAVGYLDAAGDLDMAIAIRTAVIRDGDRVRAGRRAGIVADSDPGRRGAGVPQQGPRGPAGALHRRHPRAARRPVSGTRRHGPGPGPRPREPPARPRTRPSPRAGAVRGQAAGCMSPRARSRPAAGRRPVSGPRPAVSGHRGRRHRAAAGLPATPFPARRPGLRPVRRTGGRPDRWGAARECGAGAGSVVTLCGTRRGGLASSTRRPVRGCAQQPRPRTRCRRDPGLSGQPWTAGRWSRRGRAGRRGRRCWRPGAGAGSSSTAVVDPVRAARRVQRADPAAARPGCRRRRAGPAGHHGNGPAATRRRTARVTADQRTRQDGRCWPRAGGSLSPSAACPAVALPGAGPDLFGPVRDRRPPAWPGRPRDGRGLGTRCPARDDPPPHRRLTGGSYASRTRTCA